MTHRLRKSTLLVVAIGIMLAKPLWADGFTFREGLPNLYSPAGYEGADDLALSLSAPTTNGGAYSPLTVGRFNVNGSETRRGLIRFDLSSLAGNVVSVSSASLALSLGGAATSGSFTIKVHSLLAANAGWKEGAGQFTAASTQAGDSTWNQRNSGQANWAGGSGAGVAGLDYGSAELASFTWSPASVSVDIDVPSSVIQSWIDAPSSNAGLLLKPSGPGAATTIAANFAPSEFSVAGKRPTLSLHGVMEVLRQSPLGPDSLYDWYLLRRPNGQEIMIMTYRRDSILAAVDLQTGECRQISTNGMGYGLTITADHRIFLGTSMSTDGGSGASIYEYDFDQNQLTHRVSIPSEIAVYWLHTAPSGKIYGGTYPHCRLFEYDPSSNSVTKNLSLSSTQTHSSYGAVSPNGLVYAAVGMESQELIQFDPTNDTSSNIWPTTWIAPSIPRLYLGVDGNVYAIPGTVTAASTGKYLRIDTASQVSIVQSAALHAMGASPPTRPAKPVLQDGSIVTSVGANSITIQHPAGPDTVIPIGLENAPNPVHSIGVGPNGDIFATAKPCVVFGYDPLAEFSIDLPLAAMPNQGGGGQIDSLAGYGSELFLGTYGGAKVYSIDSPATSPAIISNGPLGQQQDRIRGMRVGSDKVYMGSFPDYGLLGGSLSILVPSTGAISVDRTIAGDQSILTVAISSDQSAVYLGTSIYGGTGSTPTTTTARLIKCSSSGTFIASCEPIANAAEIVALVAIPGHLCGLTKTGYWFVVNESTLAVEHTQNLNLGITPALTDLIYNSTTQKIYGIVGRSIITANASTPNVVNVASQLPATQQIGCGPVADTQGRLYFGYGDYLARWTP